MCKIIEFCLAFSDTRIRRDSVPQVFLDFCTQAKRSNSHQEEPSLEIEIKVNLGGKRLNSEPITNGQ